MRNFANFSIRFNKKWTTPPNCSWGFASRHYAADPSASTSEPNTMVENTPNHFEHKVIALNHEGKAAKPADAYGVRFAYGKTPKLSATSG
jgi:hypothetical protein